MKKTVPFEIFGANQYLMFDIMRIAELERVCGKSIQTLLAEQQIGFREIYDGEEMLVQFCK